MKLLDYIRGKRKGEQANAIERKAMNDAFLRGAIEGFDKMDNDYMADIRELEERLLHKQSRAIHFRLYATSIAALIVVACGVLFFLLKEKPSLDSMSQLSDIQNVVKDSATRTPLIAKAKPMEGSPKIIKRQTVSDDRISDENAKPNQEVQAMVAGDSVNKANNLEEVVVVGYGAQKRTDVTGAVATVKGESIQTRNNQDVAQTLSGHVLGIDIDKIGENTENKKRISVRGLSSVGKNLEPLYVVDGKLQKGNLNSLDPKDIASIDILKDSSATAIYGSGGRNGVVRITTKSASSAKVGPILAAAQIVKGKIVDEDNQPIIGASVSIKETHIATTTDVNGNFELKVPSSLKNSKLMAQYVGLKTKEQSIQPDMNIISLSEDSRTLSEVVVVEYGSERKKKFGKNEFVEFFKCHYNKDLCSENRQIKIEITFKLDKNGYPTMIGKPQSNCQEINDEVVYWLEKSPQWTEKTKKITLKFKIVNR